jgi:ABC-type uncharacterized transport system substrate-binding protein
MKRRKFITLLGGVAAAWPFALRAQQAEPTRRLGVLMNLAKDDPESERRIAAFLKRLSELGWVDGKNLRVDYRWSIDAEMIRKNAAELLALAPNAIMANAPPSVLALQHMTRTVPIVFAAVTDPVVMGIVQSLERPGGNTTGFTSAEFGMSAKWLELLKEIAPGVKRVAVLENPSNPGALPQFTAIQAVAPTFQVDVSHIDVGDPGKIERGVADFAHAGNGGLIVTRTSEAIAARNLIVALAAQFRLPAVYPLRVFVAGGGLASYGPDIVDEYREAAGYIDRILRGEKPANLPVQAATKYELVINQKTANAIGLDLPQMLLARADEVIE